MRQSAFPASATTHFLSEDCTNISVLFYSLTFQAIESLLVCIFRLLVLRFRSVYSWALSMSPLPLQPYVTQTQPTKPSGTHSLSVSTEFSFGLCLGLLPLSPAPACVVHLYSDFNSVPPRFFCSPPTRTGTVRFACGAIRRPFDGHSVSPKSFLINSKAKRWTCPFLLQASSRSLYTN